MIYNTKGCLMPKFKSHWKELQTNALKKCVFLQYLVSCKISRIFEKIPKKCVKLHNLKQKIFDKMKNEK